MTKEKIEEIAKRRGFFWQSSEIYGGLSGFYDYAHLGTLMKRKWEDLWRDFFLNLSDDFFEIDPVNIMPEAVFQASGHLKSFVDPIVKCKKCKNMERADHLVEENLKETFEGLTPKELDEVIRKHNLRCPKCKGEFEEVGILNMMFPVTLGYDTKAYLRPETAQGVYVNFRREFECLRKKLPLGLAIVGKAYRNEISPRNLLVRMREFTQAELQIFFDSEKIGEHERFGEVENYVLRLFPVSERAHNKIVEMTCGEAVKKLQLPKFYVYHLARVQQFYLDVVKIPQPLFRFRQLSDEEKAFYNKYHWDVEMYIESLGGFKEMGGIHYRTDHDLGGHASVSKQDMTVFVDGKRFVPHVLELSFGVDRNIYALMELFYKEEKERSLFNFPRLLAPYDCALFPLVNKDGLPEKTEELKKKLQEMKYFVFFDGSGSIGRRYRRMDEIGVPLCLTVDHDTLQNDTVTLRDRDSMKQVRVRIRDLAAVIHKFLSGEAIEKLGELVTKTEKE